MITNILIFILDKSSKKKVEPETKIAQLDEEIKKVNEKIAVEIKGLKKKMK